MEIASLQTGHQGAVLSLEIWEAAQAAQCRFPEQRMGYLKPPPCLTFTHAGLQPIPLGMRRMKEEKKQVYIRWVPPVEGKLRTEGRKEDSNSREWLNAQTEADKWASVWEEKGEERRNGWILEEFYSPSGIHQQISYMFAVICIGYIYFPWFLFFRRMFTWLVVTYL